jgi:protein involved in polysaccharide export with SLBB domain
MGTGEATAALATLKPRRLKRRRAWILLAGVVWKRCQRNRFARHEGLEMTWTAMKGSRFVLAALLFGAGVLPACSAPKPIIPAPQMVGTHYSSRQQLEAIADSLRATIATFGKGSPAATAAEASLLTLQERLENGDFHGGDVVFLIVPEDQRWSDTFTVRPNQTIELPDIEPISLFGALYSEGPDRVREALSVYLRDPQITMETTKRVAILGGVAAPGFYYISGPELVSAAIMSAGGPMENARMDKVELRRREEAIARLPSDIVQSMTLDDLGVQSGDEIFVPTLEQANLFLRNVGLIIGIAASAVAFVYLVF